MQAGTLIDFAQNFEDCASAWASRIGKPFAGQDGPVFDMDLMILQALYRGIYPETIDTILCDPPAFSARVSAYLHGLS